MSDIFPTIKRCKGELHTLKGKLVAYVHVDADQADLEASNPLSGMVHHGILAVQANYLDQRNIRDFFREEFGLSMEKGIQEIIDQAKDNGGLEGALDPEAVRERLESMKNADLIPIPAKIARFHSEEELLESDADIYYLGRFSILSHAHLCVNSFPILYQAYFREQEQNSLVSEIEALLHVTPAMLNPPETASLNLTEIEKAKDSPSKEMSIFSFEGDIKSHLLKVLIPRMMYSLNKPKDYELALNVFRNFMREFSYPKDIEDIIHFVESDPGHNHNALRKLELLVAKVVALHEEDWEGLDQIRLELQRLNSN